MLGKNCQMAHIAFSKIYALDAKNGNSDILNHPYVRYYIFIPSGNKFLTRNYF